jgi:hypothetical protein
MTARYSEPGDWSKASIQTRIAPTCSLNPWNSYIFVFAFHSCMQKIRLVTVINRRAVIRSIARHFCNLLSHLHGSPCHAEKTEHWPTPESSHREQDRLANGGGLGITAPKSTELEHGAPSLCSHGNCAMSHASSIAVGYLVSSSRGAGLMKKKKVAPRNGARTHARTHARSLDAKRPADDRSDHKILGPLSHWR